MSNLCLLSPVILRFSNKLNITFLCPQKCPAKSSLGLKLCISSHVCAIAPLLRFDNNAISLAFKSPIFHRLRDYIISLAKAVYLLRFKNYRLFRDLYDYLLADKSTSNSLKDALLLHPRTGYLYFDGYKALNIIDSFTKGSHKIPRRLVSYLKSVQKELSDGLKSMNSSILSFLSAGEVNNPKLFQQGEVLGQYSLKPFSIKICSLPENPELIYQVKFTEELGPFLPIVWSLSTLMRIKYSADFTTGHGYLSRLLLSRFRMAIKAARRLFPEVNNCLAPQIALLATFDSIGFIKLLPFLIDDMVEEFFIDAPGVSIYLDHSSWGRCRSNISINKSDVERILTQLRAESSLRLDYSSPSLKTDVITKFFHVRVSVDAPPLTVGSPSIIFRRFRSKPWTIIDLINNGTISSEAAAYLIFCLFRRRNIMAIGEPATGKTTLINALDMLTPLHWRKITIESVVESIDQLPLGRHQVRFRVDPFEKSSPTRRKYWEVIRLLHRSPNYLYLGEILTREHVKALLYALSSGLRGLETCHASSPESLLVKWVVHYGVPAFCLNDLDVIVLMKRRLNLHVNRRYVARITEPAIAGLTDSLNSIRLVDVFKRNSYSEPLKAVINLYESPTLQKIRCEESIDEEAFTKELIFYKELLEHLCNLDASSPEVISNVFAKAFCSSQKGFFDVEEVIGDVRALTRL